jgi:hypothetical protein
MTEATVDLAHLSTLSPSDLEALWRSHLGASVPSHLPRILLARLLAYRLQVQAHGDVSKAMARALDRVADDVAAGREPAVPYPADNRLKPGTLLVRDHGGVEQRVMVLDKGFAWNGQTFDSLSSVAKAITGTAWNGRRFFGLQQRSDREGSRIS